MATHQELTQRIQALKDQASRQAGAMEQAELQYEAARQRIIDEGYDPDFLTDQIAELEQQLEDDVVVLSGEIQDLYREVNRY